MPSDKIFTNRITLVPKTNGSQIHDFTFEHTRGFGTDTMKKLFGRIYGMEVDDGKYWMNIYEKDGQHFAYVYDIEIETEAEDYCCMFKYKRTYADRKPVRCREEELYFKIKMVGENVFGIYPK